MTETDLAAMIRIADRIERRGSLDHVPIEVQIRALAVAVLELAHRLGPGDPVGAAVRTGPLAPAPAMAARHAG